MANRALIRTAALAVLAAIAASPLDRAPAAELLAAALQTGTLSLTLRSLVDATPSSHPEITHPTGAGNRLNMIRFGVPSAVTAR